MRDVTGNGETEVAATFAPRRMANNLLPMFRGGLCLLIVICIQIWQLGMKQMASGGEGGKLFPFLE